MDFDSNPPELEANNKCDLENCGTQTILSHLLGSAFFFFLFVHLPTLDPSIHHRKLLIRFCTLLLGGGGVLVFITKLIDQYYNNRSPDTHLCQKYWDIVLLHHSYQE